ncbi:uncharacterized protein LOC122523280 isoform X1 [Polistes fuscatus]|uniref:uncharacterized protein LOC122523280 isoform X1 n=1 Tax=Polistes fuscatus TaxID=30207 RepID=UPI001CA8FC27|nr:uncharacterized protein LOC122523280 isoform X1 [Polistes fuscatus]XP_043500876.1 uncharacterized protein LOC122523280 isoform X1 [Polistes fuscatus]XP_043500877.1 uncharacterized protein LOC122523280 isoform X1 [Polistes fuscatus]
MPHNLNSASANSANTGPNHQAYPHQPYHRNGDGLQPEKEPVEFDTSHLRGAPAEVEALVHNIKDVAQQFLYHWRTFPIILPPPLSTNTEGEDTLARKKHHLKDLFVAPSFDELDAVAVDSKGEPRRLTNKQLESIRERGLHKDKYGKPKKLNATQLESIRKCGEFEVDSINFAGQIHRWRLSALLQRGRDRRREALLRDLALATRFLVVTAKARLVSHCFSVSQSFKAFLTGFLRLLDIIIGVPSLQAHNLDAKIREERCRYLVAELVCRPEYEDSLELLCGFVRKQLRRATMEKFEVERESSQLLPVPIPFVFGTPGGAAVDLRLFSRDIIRKALPILVSILEKETRGWFLHFRERLISELRAQKKPDEEIEREVNEAVMREYLQRVYTNILSHPDILALGEGIAQLLVQQAQSVVLMHRAIENVQRKLLQTKECLRQHIEFEHPVLSRIQPWMRDRMREAEENFIEECEWCAHEEALALCSHQNLQQTCYFLNRDLVFMKEREPVLLKELRKVKTPTRSFQWPTQIWLPKNWIIRRNFQGQSEIIPTVLSNTPTSITTPRADPSQAVFLVEREVVRTTTTRWPMWRWINYIARTWCWTWNAMFLLGVAVPWYSPVSIRALLLVQPFTPDLELSQLNGTLFPRKSSQMPTLCSRLVALWRHISKSRTHFETEPDTGFIGKGMTRHLNRLWNYGAKGLLGTLVILFIFPVVCILASFGSLLIALTAIMWMPLITLTLHAFMALIMDLDSPEPSRNRYLVVMEALVWNIGIQGCLQPIAALIVALVVCPIISFVILTVAVIRYCIRVVWDTIMFHLVIKNRGRIPASDSFVVKRIAGPGLASDYYYQIRPEQALAAFEAKLELDELLAFQQEIERLITQPQRDFSQFVEACFGPFAAGLAKMKDPYKSLEKEARDLIAVLHEKLERRRKNLQTGLSVAVRSKIKLTTFDLKVVIQQGALMLERLYPLHVFARLTGNEEDFWENKGLGVGDWAGLAGLMYADIFSLDFLQPLDDSDTKFRLEPHPGVDLSRYTDMVHSTELGGINGPDLLGAVYAPRGNIQVHSPYLEVSAFNPRAKQASNSKKSDKRCDTTGLLTSTKVRRRTVSANGSIEGRWQPWKRQIRPYSAEKLVIPLPIPHPAHIAITIHNRDSEDPIPLDSELCQNILRAIEESPGEMATECVSRYRGGGDSSFDSVASQSSVSIETGLDKDNDETQQTANNDKEGENYHWTLSNWGGGVTRRRNNSGSIKVDLASPEDVTLDTDTTRAMFSTYGTTV